MPYQGHSGGLLVGVNDDICEISDYEESNHFQSIVLTNREDNFKWRYSMCMVLCKITRSRSSYLN